MQLEDFERKRLEVPGLSLQKSYLKQINILLNDQTLKRRERAEKMTPRDLEVGIHDGEVLSINFYPPSNVILLFLMIFLLQLITLLCRNCSQRVNVDSIDKLTIWFFWKQNIVSIFSHLIVFSDILCGAKNRKKK